MSIMVKITTCAIILLYFAMFVMPALPLQALKSAQSRAKELASSAQEVSSDVQRILARFDAAQVAVDEGDLEDAVAQLESLSGYAGEAVKDWIADARQRIACDEAVSLLQSRAVIRAATLY